MLLIANLAACRSIASSKSKDISDIVSVEVGPDNSFTVTCSNGKRETVSQEQYNDNQVCKNLGIVCQLGEMPDGKAEKCLKIPKWENIQPLNSSGHTELSINKVFAADGNNIWAVGWFSYFFPEGGRQTRMVALFWNGTTLRSSDAIPGVSGCEAVFGKRPNDIVTICDDRLYSWNGSNFQPLADSPRLPDDSLDGGPYTGIWGADSILWMTTNYRRYPADYAKRGGVVTKTGNIVDYFETGEGKGLNSVFGTDTHHVWCVGNGGTTIFWNGIEWKRYEVPQSVNLNGIWMSSENEAFAVGDKGMIIRWTGNSWSKMESGTNERLLSISGTSFRNIWASGDNGVVLRYDGARWQKIPSPNNMIVNSVTVPDGNSVWLVTGEDPAGERDSQVWRIVY